MGKALAIQAGDKFNLWTSLETVTGVSRCLCRCGCGIIRNVNCSDLRKGTSKSCGHSKREKTKQNIHSGEIFSQLTAIRELDATGSFRRYLFVCVCGKEHAARNADVLNGETKSCGCRGKISNYCVRCRTQKTPDDFYDAGKLRRSVCKECVQTKSRFRHRDNAGARKAAAERHAGHRSTKVGRITFMLRGAKGSAGTRCIPFILIRSDIEKKLEEQNWTCARTGVQFELTAGPFLPSIDRIDNSRGYEPGNIQIVCYMYNLAKNKFSDVEVLAFASALVERQQKPAINKPQLRIVS